MAFYEVTTQNTDILTDLKFNGDAGDSGEVVYKPITGSTPVWEKITGLCSKFVDTTSTQDLAVTPYNIKFDKIMFNDANIEYDVDSFRINDEGYYKISFTALLNSDQAQVLIGFYVNGSLIMNNLSSLIPSGIYYSPYSLETVYYFQAGDTLTIVGENYIHGPCYLMVDPIYNNPVTQLIITRQ